MAKVQYWLVKSEPGAYSFAQLQKDGRTEWTGIRNYEARNNLRAMKPGDVCLYYHTGDEKAVVGLAKVLTEAREDSTAPGEDWASVDLAPIKPLTEPVTLKALKADPAFATFPLVAKGRLSVAPVSAAHFQRVLKLGRTKL